MSRDAVLESGRRARGRTVRRGYSLVETLVALVIMGVLIAMGVPRFQLSMEQARANVACANLQAIWSAQRLFWLENRTYATDLGTLQAPIQGVGALPLVDPSLPTSSGSAPYTYQVSPSGDGSATATRSGSSSWSGSFTIAADGSLSGSVQQSGQSVVIGPSFQ